MPRGRDRTGIGVAPRLVDLGYLVALVTIGPFYWAWRLVRKKTGVPIRRRLGFGLPRRAGDEPLVWIHAVSVGEVVALRGFVTRLQAVVPGVRVLITVTTTSGLEVARKSYADLDVRESPIDWSSCVARYLDAYRPSALVLVEAELWPNLLAIAGRRGVPVYVVNARVSDRSLGRYKLLTRVCPRFLDPVRTFLMQAADQEPRFRALGIAPERLLAAGNIKFDNAHVQDPAPLRRQIREARLIPEGAPVLVAGSTHPGEERAVVLAFQRLRAEFPSAALILAPRHVERLGEVTELLDGVRLKTLRLSERSPKEAAPCTLVDTVGELASLYAAGDVAFVGGSLRPIGGHNLLEPARFGIPMVTGPHLKSVRTLATTFEQSGALTIIRDSEGLIRTLRALFSDRIGAAARGRAAQAEIAANQGAAGRCAEAVAAGLPKSTTNQSTTS